MEIGELIQCVEELPVETISVSKYGKSFQVYPWLKTRLFNKLIIGAEVYQEKTNSVFWSQFKSLFRGVTHFFGKYDAWIFTNSYERMLLDGKWKDKTFDGLVSLTKWKVLTIELMLSKNQPNKLIPTKHRVSRAFFIFLEEIYTKLFLRRTIQIENETSWQKVKKLVGVDLKEQDAIKKCLAQYKVMSVLLRLMRNPKVVLMTVSYTHFGYIHAFKEKGIRVIELQHGIIGESHVAYNFQKQLDGIQFPDEIWVIGTRDQLFFESKTAFPVAKARVIGSYMLDFYKAKWEIASKQPSTICVTLQDGNLSEILLDFILHLDAIDPGRFQFYIKTRRQPKTEFTSKFGFGSNFYWSETNVYQAIGETDIHLTIYSTTAIEAIGMGRETILFDYDGHATDVFGAMLQNNPYATFVSNAQQAYDFLTSHTCSDSKEVAASIEELIGSNYPMKVKELIESIDA